MSNPFQNWKCKCGRGPSIEHGVGEYCSGRIAIEALESSLSQSWMDVVALRQQVKKLEDYRDEQNETIFMGYALLRDAENIRDSWKSQAEKLAEACQATHDYFSYLCKVYHGEKTETGKPKVSSQAEIERLCDRAGLLCKQALQSYDAMRDKDGGMK